MSDSNNDPEHEGSTSTDSPRKYLFRNGRRNLTPNQDETINTSRSSRFHRRTRAATRSFDEKETDETIQASKRRRNSPNDFDTPTNSSSNNEDPSPSSSKTPTTTSNVTCNECGKVLKNHASYNTHRNYIHGTLVRATIKCPEPNCNTLSTTLSSLMSHLIEIHGYPLKKTTKNFVSMEKFNEWFKKLTSDGAVEFVKKSGPKENNAYSRDQMYYCAVFARKQRDPNSDGTACPAYIRVCELKSSGRVKAELQLSHIGHACEPKYTTLGECAALTIAYAATEKKLKEAEKIFDTRLSSSVDLDNHPTIQMAVNVLNKLTSTIDNLTSMFSTGSLFPASFSMIDMEQVETNLLAQTIVVEDSAFVDGQSHHLPGAVGCGLCSVILPSYNEFLLHRMNIHQIVQWDPAVSGDPTISSAIVTEDAEETRQIDFNRSQICQICSENFETADKTDVWFCGSCTLIFHQKCKDGHALICKNSPTADTVDLGVPENTGVHDESYYQIAD